MILRYKLSEVNVTLFIKIYFENFFYLNEGSRLLTFSTFGFGVTCLWLGRLIFCYSFHTPSDMRWCT